jgi:uncharacterized protein (DUF427 family)
VSNVSIAAQKGYRSMQRPIPSPAAPGQESVWDYPRPPRVEPDDRHVVVRFAGNVVADTRRALRILETSHPPVFYIPPEDVRVEWLVANSRHSWCEFKGEARYYDLVIGDRVSESAAWCYPEPAKGFQAIQHAIAFYPGRVDECTVGGMPVRPQAGGFYGGWITDEIVGPFKGDPGTDGW